MRYPLPTLESDEMVSVPLMNRRAFGNDWFAGMAGMEKWSGALPVQCTARWDPGGGGRDPDGQQRWRFSCRAHHELFRLTKAWAWLGLLPTCVDILAKGANQELHLLVSPI